MKVFSLSKHTQLYPVYPTLQRLLLEDPLSSLPSLVEEYPHLPQLNI